jgi:hypothetical protein
MRTATFRSAALGLPDATEVETWGEATFRVRNKMFAMLGSDGKQASIKATRDEQQALIAENPDAYFVPSYVGAHGWVGVVIAKADRAQVEELLTEGWRMTATKRAVAAFDAEHA